MRIVLFLNLCTCNHLDSILFNVLKLTGALALEVAGPRVDSDLGLGALPRLDGFHDLVSLSSLDVEVVVEGVGSSVSLSMSNSSVQATWNLLGILIVRDHVVMASTDLVYSSVLSAFPAVFLLICSTSTSFLKYLVYLLEVLILIVRAHMSMASLDLAYGVVFTAWVFTSVSSSILAALSTTSSLSSSCFDIT
jgi:hypothetical protein